MRVPVNARVKLCTHTNSGSNRDSDGCKLQDRYMARTAPQYAAGQECASRMSQPAKRATRAVHTDNAKHTFSKQCTSLCVCKSQELTCATCAAHTDVSQSKRTHIQCALVRSSHIHWQSSCTHMCGSSRIRHVTLNNAV
jgi:hypothetical protein